MKSNCSRIALAGVREDGVSHSWNRSVKERLSKNVLGAILFSVLVTCANTREIVAQDASRPGQFAGSNSNQRRSQPSSMQIVSRADRTSTTHYYTIVGAVTKSGVYSSSESRLTLGELLDHAGGITEFAGPAIRVVRSGRVVFQIYPASDRDSNLLPGDVLVVPPKPNARYRLEARRVTPVACLGLDERPIVLPCSRDIITVEDLTIRLVQPNEVAKAARILSPHGQLETRELVPGTVIYFDPTTIDKKSLELTQSFPKAIVLPEKEGIQTTATLSTDLPTVRPSEIEVQLPALPEAPAESSQLSPAPLLVNPMSSSITVGEERPTALPETERKGDPDPQEDLASRLFPEDEEEIRSETANGMQPGFDEQTPHLDQELVQKIASISKASPSPETLTPTPVLRYPTIKSVEVTSVHSAPAPPEEIEIASEVEAKQATPATTKDQVEMAAKKRIERQKASGALAAASSESATGSMSAVPLLMSVGLLGLLCLVGSILWSRYDRKQARAAMVAAPATRVEEPSALPVEEPKGQILKSLVNRAIPIIEEEVLLPREIQFHGEAVGHRRIVIHDRHEGVRAPHFMAKRPSAASQLIAAVEPHSQQRAKERREPLDQSGPNTDFYDREEQNTGRTSFRNERADSQRHADDYDIVQPGESAVPKEESPLERALRALAKEKN